MSQLSFLSVETDRPPLSIRELPESERPAKRLDVYGPSALSTTELLAILLGTSYQLTDAAKLLATFENLTGIRRARGPELESLPGIGPAASARIRAALELATRCQLERDDDRPQIRSPADAANLLLPEMSVLEKEHMVVLLLDTKNRVLARPTVYVGSLNTSLIRVGEIYTEALRRYAASIIVAHNHPSGDPTPSPEDVAVTRMIVEASKILDVEILDHLIIGKNRFVSLKERGLGFS